jgi:hypothetical protein
MTASAATNSVLSDPSFLAKLGLMPLTLDDTGQTFLTPFFSNKSSNIKSYPSILQLLRFGAEYEDTLRANQYVRHFFNPLNGQPLVGAPAFGGTPRPSPSWALEDDLIDSAQQFSYRWGRIYFYNALTSKSLSDRSLNWGLTFQTLGHVMHHVEDMAQPQHTRGDLHCDNQYFCNFLGIPTFGYLPLSYEKWIGARGDGLPLSGYSTVYSTDDPVTFNSPRKFWTSSVNASSGVGIAEYSNRNFFTAGTNVGSRNAANFPSPQLLDTTPRILTLQQACNDPNLTRGNSCVDWLANQDADLVFYASTVSDNYAQSSSTNTFAASKSLLDNELKKKGKSPQYSVNRFTYDAAADYLIPRAVGYAAGLLNYFFRGDINIRRDPTGVLVIENNGPEPMSGEFKLYFDDANGNRSAVQDANGQDVSWKTDKFVGPGLPLSPGASMNVSDFVSPATNPKTFMLVFRGDMGTEKEASGTPAIVARSIGLAPGNNALFIRALLSNGQQATLRTDSNGTAIVQANEFDPFYSVATPPYGGFDHSWGLKQYKKTGLTNRQYQTISVAAGFTNTRTSVYDRSYSFPEGGGFTLLPGHVSWIAKSADPVIGSFVFSTDLGNDYAPAATQSAIAYQRTYVVNGVQLTSSGLLPFPVTPWPPEVQGLVSNDWTGFPRGLQVSEDGLTLRVGGGGKCAVENCSFVKTTTVYYPMYSITLAPIPLVTASTFKSNQDQSVVQEVTADPADNLIVGSGSGFFFVFRGISYDPTKLIIESSPGGDVFLAYDDGTVFVQDSKSSNIKQFVKPANVISLLAAMWL